MARAAAVLSARLASSLAALSAAARARLAAVVSAGLTAAFAVVSAGRRGAWNAPRPGPNPAGWALWNASDTTGTGVESGSCRTETRLESSCWNGSSGCAKVSVAVTESLGLASVSRGGRVSWMKAYSSGTAVTADSGLIRTVSNASRGSRRKFLLASSTPKTRYSPRGRGPNEKLPEESASARYGRLSGSSTASTSARADGLPAFQSNTRPVSVSCGSRAPVVKVTTSSNLALFWRTSLMPGSSSTRYTRLGFQPSAGRTLMRLRCQPMSGTRSVGDRMTSLSRSPVPSPWLGLVPSETTSLKLSPALVGRTVEIAAGVPLLARGFRYHFPSESLCLPGETPDAALRRLVEEGVLRRYPGGAPPAVRDQIEKELALIAELLVAPYFLSVQPDRRDRARQAHPLPGPRQRREQRGLLRASASRRSTPRARTCCSSASSPASGASRPDIDVDFEHERREEVIQAIYERTAAIAPRWCPRSSPTAARARCARWARPSGSRSSRSIG